MDFTFADLIKNVVYFGGISALTAASVSPMQFLKIIRQQTGEKYFYIMKKYFLKDGFAPFYRGAYPYAKINLYSSAAFGVSEFFMIALLKKFGFEVTIIGTLSRALSAGILETLLTARSEVKEISRNKAEFMKSDGTVRSIIEMIFIRNTLFWLGSLLSFYFISKSGLSDFSGTLLSFGLGIVFAIITIPFDIAATHSCGDDIHYSTFKRIKKIVNEGNGYSATFHGSIMRILQMAIFTSTTAITEMLLR